MRALGVDIGGANIKMATEECSEIIYFPLWKKWEELEARLREIYNEFEPHKVGVVVTAEMADCFSTRDEGIRSICSAVRNGFSCKTFFLDIEGEIQSVENIEDPRLFYASNWMASTKFLLSEGWRDFILADMGSTTTDLIPVTDRPQGGRSDHQRLKRGELFYGGVLRTPVFHILSQFGVPLVPEYFALTADALVTTGDIQTREYVCDAPDGRGKSKEECMSRLARTVCLDLKGNEEFITELAHGVKKEMIREVEQLMARIKARNGIEIVAGCGIGEFILRQAAENVEMDYISLSEHYPHTDLFPAYAVSKLVEEHE